MKADAPVWTSRQGGGPGVANCMAVVFVTALRAFHHTCQFCQGELPENIPRGEKEPSLARLAD